MTQPHLAAFARMELKPGDVVVAKYVGTLAPGLAGRLAEELTAILPEGCHSIVIDENFDLSVLTLKDGSNAALT